MMKVWLSSTYYLDEAVLGLSANAERFFTRAWAYCGSAETAGYINEIAINMLGLSNPKKLVRELVDANILTVESGGRWYFVKWEELNAEGDKLIERRRSDRERQARSRANRQKPPPEPPTVSRPESRDASRERSRDVTGVEERREEENSGYVHESATDSNANSVSATPGADLVRSIIPSTLPAATRTELRLQANALLKQGHTPADVAASLQLWMEKTGVAPRLLPNLLADVMKSGNQPTPGGNSRVAPSKRKVNTALALANQFAEQPTTQPALEA